MIIITRMHKLPRPPQSVLNQGWPTYCMDLVLALEPRNYCCKRFSHGQRIKDELSPVQSASHGKTDWGLVPVIKQFDSSRGIGSLQNSAAGPAFSHTPEAPRTAEEGCQSHLPAPVKPGHRGKESCSSHYIQDKWRIPKIMGTILGIPIIRTIILWGLYWGPPILRNYQITNRTTGHTTN